VNPLALVFVDGLGLGDRENPANPLRDPELSLLGNFHEAGWVPPTGGGRPSRLPAVVRTAPLPRDGVVVATDASLGVPGLPQSATGQTTLLTGVNAAATLNRHYTGFPTRTLQKILAEASIFKRVASEGRRGAFLNAYTPRFFEAGDEAWGRSMGATSWACRAGGTPFRSFEDIARGRAVFHDITGDSGTGAPGMEPEVAGRILAREAARNDFLLFEFFLTDKAGHARDAAWAHRELVKLERFLAAALESCEATLVVTSDHGNIEDLGTRTHTLNPVPTLVFGPGAAALAPRLDRLERFVPAILTHLGPAPDRSSFA